MNKHLKLVLLVVCPLIIGSLSGYLSSGSFDTWYYNLNKPSWNPPGWLFGPVWTVLYLIMGYSSYRVSQKKKTNSRDKSLILYSLQLFLNFWWSILFFRFHLIGTALIEIIILWVLIVAMIINFRRVDVLSAYLNIPYLIWVSFATYLTWSIYSLN